MHIQIDLTQEDIENAIKNYIREEHGIDLHNPGKFRLHIEVKSKQNYKSEWEEAAFRAKVISS